MTAEKRIAALVPAYNESGSITRVVSAALEYLPVLVVDDGSTDKTSSLAESAGATVLRQQPNQGKGTALKAGFRYALDHGFDAVLTLDGDGQHDPDEIPKFLQAYVSKGSHLIVGQRDFAQMPLTRRLANTVGRWFFSRAMGRYIPDNQSGYRLIDRQLMEPLLTSSEQGFQFEVEMILVCVKLGLTLDWVDIKTIYAGESSHISPLEHATEYLRILRLVRRSMREQT
jgi:glycosyltransferase involved in cell wall biosynthesis